MTTVTVPSAADYQAIFEAERVKDYPVVDAFEERMGFAINRAKLESAARVLACPLKKSLPNWQHGRVLYALVRNFASAHVNELGIAQALDVGTAKGFSALCMASAFDDVGYSYWLDSVDVIDPKAKVRRNTVAEVDGLKTLDETLEGFDDSRIMFHQSTGIDFLRRGDERICVAFIDGKHTGSVVEEEGRLLASRQHPGDVVMFDDVHLDDVNKAVISLSNLYELETLRILPNRAYAIGVRR